MTAPLLTPEQARKVARWCAPAVFIEIDNCCEPDLNGGQEDLINQYVTDELTHVLENLRLPEEDGE